jgi:hypothetical protein
MEGTEELKIWKYMDLAKFLALLTTSSLYFASPARFQDFSEGSLPKSHVEAVSMMIQKSSIDTMLALRPQFAARSLEAVRQLDHDIRALVTSLKTQATSRGVPELYARAILLIASFGSDIFWSAFGYRWKSLA